MTTTTTDLATALDHERKRQGLTLTHIINNAGISRAAVYRLFKGGDVQLTTLLAVTHVLGIDLVTVPGRINALLQSDAASKAGFAASLRALPRAEAANGPTSAVAARAARIDSKLRQGRP